MINDNNSPEKKIELHHHSIEEIMGTPPSIMLRVGSGLFLLIITLLFIASAFINFPDTIKTTAILQGKQVLDVIIAPQSGIITTYINGDRFSNAGDTIICIQSDNHKEIVISTFSGFLEYSPILNNSYIQKNDTIGFIWRDDNTPITCIVQVPPNQIKQVGTGNNIRLSLNKYPAEQFGYIETYVKSIHDFGNDDFFQIIAEIPSQSITTEQTEILIRGNLHASAEIITGNQTLFNRLVNPFRALNRK
jgi:hypothetical protein